MYSIVQDTLIDGFCCCLEYTCEGKVTLSLLILSCSAPSEVLVQPHLTQNVGELAGAQTEPVQPIWSIWSVEAMR